MSPHGGHRRRLLAHCGADGASLAWSSSRILGSFVQALQAFLSPAATCRPFLSVCRFKRLLGGFSTKELVDRVNSQLNDHLVDLERLISPRGLEAAKTAVRQQATGAEAAALPPAVQEQLKELQALPNMQVAVNKEVSAL